MRQTEAAVAAALAGSRRPNRATAAGTPTNSAPGRSKWCSVRTAAGQGGTPTRASRHLPCLAFLGAGHSHLQGDYQDTVRRGLDFLLRSQAADGSLFGDADALRPNVLPLDGHVRAGRSPGDDGRPAARAGRRKGGRTSRLAAQNTSTGGWRYRPGDTGDTSQLGWQMMALAERQAGRHQRSRRTLGLASSDFCAPSAAAITAAWPAIGPTARPARR